MDNPEPPEVSVNIPKPPAENSPPNSNFWKMLNWKGFIIALVVVILIEGIAIVLLRSQSNQKLPHK